MINELLKKYDEMRKDMLINGTKNLVKYKEELNKLTTICFTLDGEKETIKRYQEYVRNY